MVEEVGKVIEKKKRVLKKGTWVILIKGRGRRRRRYKRLGRASLSPSIFSYRSRM